ncbi:MAG: hypothetical protein LBD57_04320 [Endomicrobium sp.]|uniref:hypothetical protein n=1 Tax=Candidatus Endomicrobiellum cubanum TaxID=3242325 RepID=UPI00282F097B|nr:hypothetical protein [Endomicrobium sp.]
MLNAIKNVKTIYKILENNMIFFDHVKTISLQFGNEVMLTINELETTETKVILSGEKLKLQLVFPDPTTEEDK